MKNNIIKVGKINFEIKPNDYVTISPISAEFTTGDKRPIIESHVVNMYKIPLTEKQMSKLDLSECVKEHSIVMGMNVVKFIFK